MIRVLLVDDQELVRIGLRGILRTQFGFDIVGECAYGSEVAAAVESLTPDVVLMDVRMPVVNGVQATPALRERDSSRPSWPSPPSMTTRCCPECCGPARQASS